MYIQKYLVFVGAEKMDSTKSFDGIANYYLTARPAYAPEFIKYLFTEQGMSDKSIIADIGSGTGKFARQLLENRCFVFCVEPNNDMRNAALIELDGYEKCTVLNGTADNTTLENNSVDYITVAQAFHWFDVGGFQKECKRILKPDGKAILVWNIRDMATSVNKESYKIYKEYCPSFKGFGGGIKKDDERIRSFFSDNYEYITFDNPLIYDKDKFIKRCLSGSYSLKETDTRYIEYMDALNCLFERYSTNEIMEMPNQTVAYIGNVR